MIDENEMRNRAEKWLDFDGTTARPVTRENALAEDMMALDVLDLLAEVARMRKQCEMVLTEYCEAWQNDIRLLRPVAEAAKRWRRCDETPLQPKPGEVFTLKDCNHDDLADAVDALIAAEAKETV